MSPSLSDSYVNPGAQFLQLHGEPHELDDVLTYARWLRSSSKLSPEAPVDLKDIYDHFRIPPPNRVPLPGQHGMLLNSDIGTVLINVNDHVMRQRFTEAHELIEFYFEAVTDQRGSRTRPSDVWLARKEDWCDEGAAELLIPLSAASSGIRRSGVTFDTGRALAAEYRVSLTASLWQMIKASPDRHAIVQWRLKHKPIELAALAESEDQLMLFGQPEDRLPKMKLRVEWAVGNSESYDFPKDKSIEEDSAIYRAWHTGIFTHGDDGLILNKRVIHFTSENQPFALNRERQVLSLITLRD